MPIKTARDARLIDNGKEDFFKTFADIKEVEPYADEISSIKQAKKDFAKGKFLTLTEFLAAA